MLQPWSAPPLYDGDVHGDDSDTGDDGDDDVDAEVVGDGGDLEEQGRHPCALECALTLVRPGRTWLRAEGWYYKNLCSFLRSSLDF